jgi:sugar O-acyltransferase (sialic acid O-acetyltransferase NeuD family)
VSKILIIGAGGHGQVIAEILLLSHGDDGDPEPIGFLDDVKAPARPSPLGLPVLGPLDRIGLHPHDAIVVAVGDNRDRARLFSELAARGEQFVTAIHPSATVSPSASLARAVMICAGAIVGTAAGIGENVILNTGSSVDHHCRIGSHAHIAPGVILGGDVCVGSGAMLGIGVRVLPRTSIGEWAVVGAGAVVTEDVPPYALAVGVPARVIKTITRS